MIRLGDLGDDVRDELAEPPHDGIELELAAAVRQALAQQAVRVRDVRDARVRAELAVEAPHLRVAVLNPGMVKTNLMRTSARFAPASGGLSAEVVEISHDALNSFGEDPDTTARSALEGLAAGRFWILPGADDPFVSAMAMELAELETSMSDRRDR